MLSDFQMGSNTDFDFSHIGKGFFFSLHSFRVMSNVRKRIIDKGSRKLTYNCAHLRSTKETLTIEYFRIIFEKKNQVKIFWGEHF